jgi:hypothetical protein
MGPVRVPKEPIAMKIIMDRSYCDASLSFCARCSAAFFRKPLGTDRLCIVDVIDDGRDQFLRIELRTDGRTLEFDLTEDVQAGLALEGWEYLADFDPGFFRQGAAKRWRELSTLPATHSASGRATSGSELGYIADAPNQI